MATADLDFYDPETLAFLRQVLDDTWERLTFEQRAQTQKSEVALRILRLAQRAERDPMRLRAGAIDA
jgi:cell division protein FtsL